MIVAVVVVVVAMVVVATVCSWAEKKLTVIRVKAFLTRLA